MILRSSDPVGVAKSLADHRQSVQIDLARRPSQAGSEILGAPSWDMFFYVSFFGFEVLLVVRNMRLVRY